VFVCKLQGLRDFVVKWIGELVMKRKNEAEKKSSPIQVKLKWVDGLRFVASDDKGHSLVMDVSKEHGGEGSAFGPMQLLLAALGGCTGTDIVGILRKQRQQLTDLEIIVSGEHVADYPKVYSKVNVEYRLKGVNLKGKGVRQAIQLSEDKYCSVGATIKKTAKLSHSYAIQ
jgi:putative redox protein